MHMDELYIILSVKCTVDFYPSEVNIYQLFHKGTIWTPDAVLKRLTTPTFSSFIERSKGQF